MWYTVVMMMVVMGSDAVQSEGEEVTAVKNKFEKAGVKIELCLFFQICFISDEDIRTDRE